MNLLAALATIAEAIASAASNPESAAANSHAIANSYANPFESRAGVSDVVTVCVVGPDGIIKDERSTNPTNPNSEFQKGTRP